MGSPFAQHMSVLYNWKCFSFVNQDLVVKSENLLLSLFSRPIQIEARFILKWRTMSVSWSAEILKVEMKEKEMMARWMMFLLRLNVLAEKKNICNKDKMLRTLCVRLSVRACSSRLYS